jgi:hypothetical protein
MTLEHLICGYFAAILTLAAYRSDMRAARQGAKK